MAHIIRVLIVDDNARSRNGLRALLDTVRLSPSAVPRKGVCNGSRSEVEVVAEAVNGLEAVRQVAKCRPDVVLMDARMPEMDGLAATRLIKTRWPRVKVVVLTLDAAYRAEALAVGADAFLVKGCPHEQLCAAILNNGEARSVPVP